MNNNKNKRNLAGEINQLKGRKEFETFHTFYTKLSKIKKAIMQLKKTNLDSQMELLRYIPVALVATMESFLRSTIASLINKDEIYLQRAKALFDANHIKLDFEILTHLQKKEYSLGEFLSHQLSFSKYEQIHSTFTTMFDADFLNELNSYKKTGLHTGLKNPEPSKFEANSQEIIKDIKKVFELRHIICHEMALKFEFSEKEALKIFNSSYCFLYQIYNYVYVILFPETFESQDVLNEKAKIEFEMKEKELSELTEQITKNPLTYLGTQANLEMFKRSNELWMAYRESYVKSLIPELYGDNLDNYYYEDMALITEDRIIDLKTDFNFE